MIIRTSKPTIEVGFYGGMFGVCPHCGDGDGLLNGLAYCKTHRVCWHVGNVGRVVYEGETDEAVLKVLEELESYTEVKEAYPYDLISEEEEKQIEELQRRAYRIRAERRLDDPFLSNG